MATAGPILVELSPTDRDLLQRLTVAMEVRNATDALRLKTQGRVAPARPFAADEEAKLKVSLRNGKGVV